MSALWFFDRLGIAPTSEPREIKRAYAVALKLIDQHTQSEEFQRLRTAYELALAWAEDARNESEKGGSGDEDEEEAQHEPDLELNQDEETPESPDMPPAHSLVNPVSMSYGESPAPAQHKEEEKKEEPPAAPASTGKNTAPPPITPHIDWQYESQQRTAALNYWLSRLCRSNIDDPAALLDAALADERLIHIETRTKFQIQLAHYLYEDSATPADLLMACADRFDWRTVIPLDIFGDTHDWIERILKQDLRWKQQSTEKRDQQMRAIRRAAKEVPERKTAFELWPILETLHEKYPNWLTLYLSPARLEAWRKLTRNIPPKHVLHARWLQFKYGSLNKKSGMLIAFAMICLILSALLSPIIHAVLDNSPSTPEPTTSEAQDKEEPLAFELTGPLNADSCSAAHMFAHESNWRDHTDDSPTLFITRIIECERKQLWPAKDDPLVSCLRAERIAALQQNRAENPKACPELKQRIPK